MNRHDGAKVFIENGVLTLQMGVDRLAFAAVNHVELMGYVDGYSDNWKPPVITDPDQFAVDVMKEINTDQDGEPTMFEAMLDSAIINAVEAGSEHITLEGDTPVSKPELASDGQ